MDNNFVRFRHFKRVLKNVSKEDLIRSNEIQSFMNHYSNSSKNFKDLCQTILFEKSK